MARSDQGSALISALGLSSVAALLAILAIQLVLNQAYDGRQAENRYRAETGFETAYGEMFRQLAHTNGTVWLGERVELASLAGEPSVTVYSAEGMLDINAASTLILDMLVREIEQGLAVEAGNASGANFSTDPAETLAAARAALALDDPAWACLSGLVTVSSAARSPDFRAGPETLQRLLYPDQDGAPQALPLSPGAGDLFILDIAAGEGGTPLRKRVLVRLTGSPSQPFLIQGWLDGYDPQACEVGDGGI